MALWLYIPPPAGQCTPWHGPSHAPYYCTGSPRMPCMMHAHTVSSSVYPTCIGTAYFWSEIGMWHDVHWLEFAATDTDTSSLLLNSSYPAWLPKSDLFKKEWGQQMVYTLAIIMTYNRLACILTRYTGTIAYSSIVNKLCSAIEYELCSMVMYHTFSTVNISMIRVVVTAWAVPMHFHHAQCASTTPNHQCWGWKGTFGIQAH